jgi:methylmalonyl-CoA/ethylmalonyl-CoA epimerase
VGLAVPSISDYVRKNSPIFADLQLSQDVVNEAQGVREAFFTDGRTTIELLEPLGPHSPLHNYVEQNPCGGLVHVCYECDDIEASISDLRERSRAKLISGPTPDVAFNGRPIAFLSLAGQVIELVQR